LAFDVQLRGVMRLLLLLGFALAACAPGATDDETSSDDGELRQGVDANLERPEVGRIGIYHPDDPSTEARCTGTLIGKRTVLAAAHCFEFLNIVSDVDVGRFNLQPANGTGVRSSGIRRVAAGGDGDFDIAVMQLNDHVSTALATPAVVDTQAPRSGDMLTIYGYGSYGGDCSENDVRKRKLTISAGNLIEITFSCPGDSGGPYFNDRTGKIVAIVKGNYFGLLEREAHPITYRQWIMDRLAESEAGTLGE
jgi:secreted trypsin-like serine protease